MGKVDPCAVSDTLADNVVSAVLDGRAESLTFPEHSLGKLDACTVVGPELLAAVPGLGGDTEPVETIADHGCWWENPDTLATLDLEFEIGHLPSGTTGTMTLLVRLPAGQGKAACTAASAIADKLWQALPPL